MTKEANQKKGAIAKHTRWHEENLAVLADHVGNSGSIDKVYYGMLRFFRVIRHKEKKTLFAKYKKKLYEK